MRHSPLHCFLTLRLSSSSHNYEENHLKMAELENKIKKEAEIREEALLKRISEKDKQISKMK